MNLAAVYHRSNDQYCYPLNRDEVRINIRVGKDVEKVEIIYGDPFAGGILGGDWNWSGENKLMTLLYELEFHNIYTVILSPKFKRLKYHFHLENKNISTYYYEDRFIEDEEIVPNSCVSFTFPWLNEIDINKTPGWVGKTIWYQIFPERFCNGNERISPLNVKKWQNGQVGSNDFYGGDLFGIYEKLEYISDLGITGIYLTPIFKSPSVHKYDTEDYMKIDPYFGDEKIFKKLVDKAHKLGIRVMLDAVFNHCGANFMPWKDVLEKGALSSYFDWFMINEESFLIDDKDPLNGEFFTFAFTKDMPKLNTNNQEVIDYFISVAKYWVEKFNIDGWRIDVANEVSHNFNRQLRIALKNIKSDIYILGEIWMDSINWLRGDQYDSVMNYPLTTAINSFWNNSFETMENLKFRINRCYSMYQDQTNNSIFNLLDSHDTNRLWNNSKDSNECYAKLALLFSMQGTVCIYYGTEVEMDGEHDPDCRRTMPWTQINNGEFHNSISKLKTLIEIRKENEALQFGNLKFHDTNDKRLIYFSKTSNNQSIDIIINASEGNIQCKVTDSLFENNFNNGILGKNGVIICKSISLV